MAVSARAPTRRQAHRSSASTTHGQSRCVGTTAPSRLVQRVNRSVLGPWLSIRARRFMSASSIRRLKSVAAVSACLLWNPVLVKADTWDSVPSGSATGNLTWQKVTCDDGTVWQPCRIPPPPPPPPPPPGPAPGDNFSLSAMICSSGDAGYYQVPSVPNQYRDAIISQYTGFGVARRCPESDGYVYWLGRIESLAPSLGYSNAWSQVRASITWAANENDERGQGGINNANTACNNAARAAYGLSATYIIGSGKWCRIN